MIRKIPQGMTIEDAVKEYEDNKTVITGNDGELTVAGTECVDCHKVYPKDEMKYCPCDEGFVCPSCCGHCGYNNRGTCIWPAD